MKKYKRLVLFTQITIITLFLCLWEIGARFGIINSFIFSSPIKILNTIINLINSGNLFQHLWATLSEVLIAFLIGIIISFIVAILMYECKFLKDVIDPFLTMLNSMPKVALGPIIIIWSGANSKSIIVMALLINVIISVITIYTGFINVDQIKLKLFKTFNASKKQILTKLIIPSSIPTIVSSLKINISLTFIGVIMGEFLVSKKGIGYLILYGTQVFNLNLVLAGILILILLSYFIYKCITLLEKKVTT